MYKILAILKKRSEIHLTLVTECLTIDNKLHYVVYRDIQLQLSENYFYIL